MMQPSLSPEQEAMTVARLLSQRLWILLETLLTSTSSSAILIDDPSLPHAVTSDIIIHFAARLQAPLRIISLLSRMYPQSLASSDIFGRYPIHVACKWASTPDIIAYLIKTNPSVVGVPDAIGKVPMHYVGEFYLQHFNHTLYNRDDSMLQVVRLLKTASPQSVNLEDNEGMNAIEYALESNVNLKVIKTMQRACRDDWIERSKRNNSIDGDDNAASCQKPQLGRRRHSDLVRDVETMALKLQREYCSNGVMDRKMSNNDRIHVHRSRTSEATTRAARTA
jgi:hypothetical protein